MHLSLVQQAIVAVVERFVPAFAESLKWAMPTLAASAIETPGSAGSTAWAAELVRDAYPRGLPRRPRGQSVERAMLFPFARRQAGGLRRRRLDRADRRVGRVLRHGNEFGLGSPTRPAAPIR